jgi:predicted ATPase
LLEAVPADTRTLIVIHNCEQVVAATAALVERLLARAAALRLLVTSRESLPVTDEQVLCVPPLGVPEGLITLAQALASDAVALSAERASARVPGY